MHLRESNGHSFYYPLIWNVFCFLWLFIGGILMVYEEQHAWYKIVHGWINDLPIVPVIWITHMGTFYFVVFLIALFLILYRVDNKKLMLMIILASQLFPLIFIQTLKAIVNAPRPSTVYGDADWFIKVPEIWGHSQSYWLSFPSGHTAGITGVFTFIILMAPIKTKNVWSIIGIIAIILVALSRMFLSQHFYVDIWMGGLISMFSGYLIYFIFRKQSLKQY